MKFCSLLLDETRAFMSCNVFFFIMKPKPETGRVFTTTLRLGFISSNLHKYVWDSIFAIARWRTLEKPRKGNVSQDSFYNRNFKGEEELSYLGTVILIPFHGSRYFCTNSLAKYFKPPAPLQKRRNRHIFPPSNLTTFYRFLFPQLYYRGKN